MEYKPDMDRAKQYWRAFWQREIIDRPCVYVTAPKDPHDRKPQPPYMAGSDGRYRQALAMFDEWAASTYFAGEAIPYFTISFGPDQFSAFLGAELVLTQGSTTTWAKPFVTDWKRTRIELKTGGNSTWAKVLEYMRLAAEFSEDKFLLEMLDLHSNMDCLAAIRGPEQLCMDLIDCPDDVEKALNEVRGLYGPIYEAIYEAGRMQSRGTIGWAPFYSEGKFATIQCDFICMISPQDARRFVIPALAEEAAFLDHSVFHYDGPGALVHLEDILAIADIDVIQWVPGTGNPLLIEWMDLLKKIQQAGKGLQITCSADEVKIFHKELRPEGVLYCVEAGSTQEADELIAWLERNT